MIVIRQSPLVQAFRHSVYKYFSYVFPGAIMVTCSWRMSVLYFSIAQADGCSRPLVRRRLKVRPLVRPVVGNFQHSGKEPGWGGSALFLVSQLHTWVFEPKEILITN